MRTMWKEIRTKVLAEFLFNFSPWIFDLMLIVLCLATSFTDISTVIVINNKRFMQPVSKLRLITLHQSPSAPHMPDDRVSLVICRNNSSVSHSRPASTVNSHKSPLPNESTYPTNITVTISWPCRNVSTTLHIPYAVNGPGNISSSIHFDLSTAVYPRHAPFKCEQ